MCVDNIHNMQLCRCSIYCVTIIVGDKLRTMHFVSSLNFFKVATDEEYSAPVVKINDKLLKLDHGSHYMCMFVLFQAHHRIDISTSLKYHCLIRDANGHIGSIYNTWMNYDESELLFFFPFSILQFLIYL